MTFNPIEFEKDKTYLVRYIDDNITNHLLSNLKWIITYNLNDYKYIVIFYCYKNYSKGETFRII